MAHLKGCLVDVGDVVGLVGGVSLKSYAWVPGVAPKAHLSSPRGAFWFSLEQLSIVWGPLGPPFVGLGVLLGGGVPGCLGWCAWGGMPGAECLVHMSMKQQQYYHCKRPFMYLHLSLAQCGPILLIMAHICIVLCAFMRCSYFSYLFHMFFGFFSRIFVFGHFVFFLLP